MNLDIRMQERHKKPKRIQGVEVLMVALSTPETLVNFYKITQCNIPEDSHLEGKENSE
jgi:hypothetical protein